MVKSMLTPSNNVLFKANTSHPCMHVFITWYYKLKLFIIYREVFKHVILKHHSNTYNKSSLIINNHIGHTEMNQHHNK